MLHIENRLWNIINDAPRPSIFKTFIYIALNQPDESIRGFIIDKIQLSGVLNLSQPTLFRDLKFLRDNLLIHELKLLDTVEPVTKFSPEEEKLPKINFGGSISEIVRGFASFSSRIKMYFLFKGYDDDTYFVVDDRADSYYAVYAVKEVHFDKMNPVHYACDSKLAKSAILKLDSNNDKFLYYYDEHLNRYRFFYETGDFARENNIMCRQIPIDSKFLHKLGLMSYQFESIGLLDDIRYDNFRDMREAWQKVGVDFTPDIWMGCTYKINGKKVVDYDAKKHAERQIKK